MTATEEQFSASEFFTNLPTPPAYHVTSPHDVILLTNRSAVTDVLPLAVARWQHERAATSRLQAPWSLPASLARFWCNELELRFAVKFLVEYSEPKYQNVPAIPLYSLYTYCTQQAGKSGSEARRVRATGKLYDLNDAVCWSAGSSAPSYTMNRLASFRRDPQQQRGCFTGAFPVVVIDACVIRRRPSFHFGRMQQSDLIVVRVSGGGEVYLYRFR